MAEQKKDEDKITDITEDKELNEKELQDASGGMLRRRPIFKAGADDCGGNCMGSVGTATGKEIEI